MSLLEQHVLRLDIPVHDALAVGVSECIGELARDLPHVLEGELLLPIEALPQGLALHVGHHIVEQAVGVAGVMQREDVRMGEVRRDLDLAQEAIAPEALGDFRPQHLEGDPPPVPEVAREVHDGPSTVTDLPVDDVAALEGPIEAVDEFGQRAQLRERVGARITIGCLRRGRQAAALAG